MADTACSVTVVGSRARIDVALPRGLPLAELTWDLADLLSEPELQGAVPRWGLVRTGGRPLSLERSLAEQGVDDGSLLFLRDLSSPPPAPVLDDYAEAVALAVEARGGRWTASARQAVLLVAATGWGLVAAIATLRLDGLPARAAGAFAGAVTLLVAGVLVARRLRQSGTGAVLALAALPLWAVGGWSVAALAGVSGLDAYPAAAGFVTAGALLALLTGTESRAPAAGVVCLLGGPAALSALCLALGATAVQVAAVLALAALAAVRFTPGLAVGLARLGSGRSPAAGGVSSRVDSGHRLLGAMLVGLAGVMAAACILLALDGGWYERGLVAAVALGAATQVRHFRFAREAAPLALAGLVGVGALELVALRYLESEPGRQPLAVTLALLNVLVLAGAALASRLQRLSPLLLRRLDQLETLALLAAVPLAAGSLGAYSAVAAAAHRLV